MRHGPSVDGRFRSGSFSMSRSPALAQDRQIVTGDATKVTVRSVLNSATRSCLSTVRHPSCRTFSADEEQGNRPAEVKPVKGVVAPDPPQSQTLDAFAGMTTSGTVFLADTR